VDWELLARPGQTAVFYMGLAHLDNIVKQLREHGVPAERSAAVIEHGTQAQQRVVTGTLQDLAVKVRAAGVESPALLIVGEVTRLHETLHWFNASGAQRLGEDSWALVGMTGRHYSGGRLTA
jgi:siroheme synthase